MTKTIEEKAEFIGVNPEKLKGLKGKEKERIEKAIDEGYAFLNKGGGKK
ncbi:MAG: hypothetical protein ABIJ08_06715 [Nanoarchaeota archaeon]|uniref:Uncharacterized protein n=1 Tax=viral metagenome TaxID=1070528 RepID=A0A6M3KVH7_9ZZZZ